MKMQPTCKILICLLSLVLPMLAGADSVFMTANDASGDSSLLNTGKWSSGAPPNATNDYFSSSYYIRTPLAPSSGTTNITFAGNSLTLQTPVLTGTGQVVPIRSIIFKGSGAALPPSTI